MFRVPLSVHWLSWNLSYGSATHPSGTLCNVSINPGVGNKTGLSAMCHRTHWMGGSGKGPLCPLQIPDITLLAHFYFLIVSSTCDYTVGTSDVQRT